MGCFGRVASLCAARLLSDPLCRPGHLLAGLADRLSSALSELLEGPTGRLAKATNRLASRLTKALSDSAECLACCTGGLRNCTTRTQSLAGRVGQPAQGLTRRATGADRLLCRLPDIAERLALSTAGSERLLTKLADAPDRVVDGVDEAFEDLRIPIERGQRPIEDVVEVLESYLQLRLRLDAFDVHLHLAEADVDAGDDL